MNLNLHICTHLREDKGEYCIDLLGDLVSYFKFASSQGQGKGPKNRQLTRLIQLVNVGDGATILTAFIPACGRCPFHVAVRILRRITWFQIY